MVQEQQTTGPRKTFEDALGALGKEIDRVIAQAQEELEERRPEIEARRQEIEARLQQLKEEGDRHWKDIQPDLERVLGDIQALLKKIAEKVG